MSTVRFDDRVVIITGAGNGLGKSHALEFAKRGAKVVVNDLGGSAFGEGASKNAADLVVDEIVAAGGEAVANYDSVTDGEKIVQTAIDNFGRIDIVVNNAGATHRNQPMLQVDEQTFDRVFAINVKSIFHMTHAVVPLLRERNQGEPGRGGVILNVGSVAGIRPRPGLTWYNSSKGAVNMLSKSMAVELAPDRIRVNAICPVMGATGLLEQFMGMPDTPENRARFISTIPLGRMCEATDVANVAVFLATDASHFLTGMEVPVDGGRVI